MKKNAPKAETFRCNCGHAEPINAYVIAQTAMGHSVTFTCDCTRKITITAKARGGYATKISKPEADMNAVYGKRLVNLKK